MNRMLWCIGMVLFTIFDATFCEEPAITEKSMLYGGNEVVYEIRGEGPNTLFFIHGWTGSRKTWKYQLGAFPDYRVIAVDLPGNGKSGKNELIDYTMDLFADTIFEILKKEEVSGAFFIGHSMGFAVAEVIAMKYPGLCKGICSMDGAHFKLPEDPTEQDAWIQYNRSFAESMKNEQGREDFINALFCPDTPLILRKEVLDISRQVPLTIGKSMIEGVETSRKYWAKRVMDIPCLAIYSPVYQLTEQDKADFLNMYPKAEYNEMKDVSHFLMLERPYAVNQILTEYLENTYR